MSSFPALIKILAGSWKKWFLVFGLAQVFLMPWENACGQVPANGEHGVFYDKDTVMHSVVYKDSLPNGPFSTYYLNGVLKSEGTMRDGCPDGPQKVYDQTGKLTGEFFYENCLARFMKTPEEAAPRKDLEMTVVPNVPTYWNGDMVTLLVKLRNVSAQPLRVRWCDNGLVLNRYLPEKKIILETCRGYHPQVTEVLLKPQELTKEDIRFALTTWEPGEYELTLKYYEPPEFDKRGQSNATLGPVLSDPVTFEVRDAE